MCDCPSIFFSSPTSFLRALLSCSSRAAATHSFISSPCPIFPLTCSTVLPVLLALLPLSRMTRMTARLQAQSIRVPQAPQLEDPLLTPSSVLRRIWNNMLTLSAARRTSSLQWARSSRISARCVFMLFVFIVSDPMYFTVTGLSTRYHDLRSDA